MTADLRWRIVLAVIVFAISALVTFLAIAIAIETIEWTSAEDFGQLYLLFGTVPALLMQTGATAAVIALVNPIKDRWTGPFKFASTLLPVSTCAAVVIGLVFG